MTSLESTMDIFVMYPQIINFSYLTLMTFHSLIYSAYITYTSHKGTKRREHFHIQDFIS